MMMVMVMVVLDVSELSEAQHQNLHACSEYARAALPTQADVLARQRPHPTYTNPWWLAICFSIREISDAAVCPSVNHIPTTLPRSSLEAHAAGFRKQSAASLYKHNDDGKKRCN